MNSLGVENERADADLNFGGANGEIDIDIVRDIRRDEGGNVYFSCLLYHEKDRQPSQLMAIQTYIHT